MEEVLGILLIFGGGAIAVFAYSPIGRAVAARIRGDTAGQIAQERLDFTERLLADRREPAALKPPED